MSRKYSVFGSFRFALDGISQAATNEPNFQLHLAFSLAAIVAGFIFNLNSFEWIVVFFTIAFVLVLELFNTAIEAIVDHLSPRTHPQAKIAKDVSAGAVFISSILALIIAAIIFTPKIILLI